MLDFSKIYQHVNLIDIFRQYNLEIKQVGSGYEVVECPFCGGHNCFRTFLDDRKWSCFQCTDGKTNKDVIDFISYMENCSISQAIQKLTSESGLVLDITEEFDLETYAIKKEAVAYYKKILISSRYKSFKIVRRESENPDLLTLEDYYLQERGLDFDFLIKNDVGFSDGKLVEHLTEIGFSSKAIAHSGLLNVSSNIDFFPMNTTIFFHHTKDLISHFSCDRGLLRNVQPLKFTKKYALPSCLFYMQNTLTPNVTVVYLTEAQWDVLSIKSVVDVFSDKVAYLSTCGKLGTEQVKFLQNLGLPVVMMFDADAEGKSYRNTLLLSEVQELYDFAPDLFGEHKDINDLILSMPKESRVEEIKKLLKQISEPKSYKVIKEKNKEDRNFADTVLPQTKMLKDDQVGNAELERAFIHSVYLYSRYDILLDLPKDFFFVPQISSLVEGFLKILSDGKQPNLNSFLLLKEYEPIRDILESPEVDILESLKYLRLYYERRKVVRFAQEIVKSVGKEKNLEDLVYSYTDVAYKLILTNLGNASTAYTPSTMSDKANEDIPDEGVVPILFGFDNLDKNLVIGCYPGTITLLAGRPGAGKSIFKMNSIKQQCSKLGYGVISRTPENGNLLDLARLDANMLNIPFKDLLLAKKDSDIYKLRQENWLSITENWTFIQDEGQIGIREIIADLLRYRADFPDIENWVVWIDLFDYMKEITESKERWSVIEKTLRQLKELSKPYNLNFSIILVAHITRDSSKKIKTMKDRKPTIHDLRGGGALENVSDLILLAHRETMYDDTLEDDLLQLIIGKQRGGPSNITTYFRFQKEFSKIEPVEGTLDLSEGIDEISYGDFQIPTNL